ncbi:MAG TPA: PAS domain S-box protein [Longimicrobiales bacterium]|nr:PAS domain S-box protein [Longimicrobiales bacterium]
MTDRHPTDRPRPQERSRPLPEQGLLDRILENAPVAIAVLKGTNLEYTLVNPAYQAIVGGETRLLGRTYGEVIPEVAEGGAEAALHRVIRTGRPWHIEEYEIDIPGRTGPTYWEGECVPLPNEHGEVDSVLLMVQEITDRKRDEAAARQAAAALRDSEARHALVVAGAAAAIWDWDVPNKRVEYSPRWRELRGLSEEEVSDSEEEWAKGIHPDDAPRVMTAVQAHFEGKTSLFAEEYRVRHKDGRWVWILDRGLAKRDDTGAVIRMVGSEIDITERKQAEATLLESEARKSAMLETALDCVIGMDHRGNVVEFNPAAERTFGYRREDILGKELAALIVPEPLRTRHRSALTRHLATGESTVLGKRVEMTAMRADGTEFPVELTVSRIPTAGPALFMAYVRDITQRKEAEASVREADRRKDEFLATLSHELRNPLAPLRNALHLLRRARVEGPVAESLHDIMERQIDQLVRLVDDLMEVARITRGTFELRREPVTIQEVLQRAFETSQPFIEGGSHRLDVSVPTEPIRLEADPVRLAQIFANLLNNAAKYTPESGEIAVEVRSEPGHVVVSVSDTGQGIDAEDLPTLFDMFSRGSRAVRHAQEGLGIGLALVRRLVEMHGGTVRAESAGLGHGSRFTVRLPLGDPAPRAEGTPAPTPRLAPHRVLVVDDNHDAATSLGTLLNFLGADVVVEYDGPSALAAFDRYRPTLVLLDIGMPGMDGYEVARAIRGREGDSRTPLVAITGWGMEKDRERARKAGFDHHLVKPAQVEVLKALLVSPPGVGPAG